MGCWEFMENKGTVIYMPLPYKLLKLSFILMFPLLAYTFLTKKITHTFSTQSLINSSLGLYKRIGIIRNCKVIVRESNSIFQLFKGLKLFRYTIGYKLGYAGVDLVICQTNVMKDNLLNALPWLEKKTKVKVIPNPINLESIEDKEKEEIPGLSTTEYIVAAGTLTHKKGFDILIDGFSKILETYPNLKLNILGRGPLKDELQQRIHGLGLENHINLQGFVRNVYPYFKHAKACVISSRIEGFPNVLLQMMTQNTRIVSTLSAGDIDAVPGIFTCPVEDKDKLIESILKCLQSHPKENRELFDEYLEQRGTDVFLEKILENLHS